MKTLTYMLAGCVAMLSCTVIEVKLPDVTITSEKTAVEKQLLGPEASTADDPLSISAVWARDFYFDRPETDFAAERGIGGDQSARSLILAQIRRQTIQDDINELKRNGLIGERADGLLKVMPDSLAGNNEIGRIVAAENSDRAAIWEFYAFSSGNNIKEQMPVIRTNFAGIMARTSPTGTWVEDADGNWKRK